MDQQSTKEDKIFKSIKDIVAIRKKPALLLNIAHVMPTSVVFLQKELRDKTIPELDVVLNTPGGHIESAYKIVKLLRKHAKKVNIIVPFYAKSAGTLICLSANSLMLSVASELGPLDVQIPEHQEGDVDTFKSALNGYKSLEQIQSHALENLDVATRLILSRTGNRMRLHDVIKLAIEFSGNTSGCLYDQVHPKTITEYARALDVGEQYGTRILNRYMGWDKNKAISVVRHLVYDYPSHGFIIDKEELSELGFITEDMPVELEEISEVITSLLTTGDHSQDQQIKLFTPQAKNEKGIKKTK